MSKPIPLSGGRKILPSREDLERQPFSFFASGKKRSGVVAKYDLSGLILDDEGDPISGVTVTLSGDADSSVVTGVDGAFLFEDLSKGDYTVTPSRASFVFTPASRSVTQLAADTALDSFEGVGSIYIISGTITGDEVENVTVTLSGDDNDEVITGADGTYSFSGLADGDYTVTPSLDGYGFTPAATNVTINNADQTGKDFVSALLVYDISGAITGDEVEGVTVALTGDANDSVVTGVGGTFTFADLPPGDYTLTPTLAGYSFAPASINVTIVAANQTDQDFVSTLVTHVVSGTVTQATYDISGLIVDGAAAGIEGVTVTLTGDASDSTTTDSNGAYSFTGLDSGSYTVTPTLTGYTFIDDHEDVTVSGGDVAVPTMADNGLVVLPFVLDFSDYPSGDLSADDGFFNFDPGNKTMGSIRTSDLADYLNSFTPDGVTGVAEIGAGEVVGFRFPHGKVLPSGLTELRIAALCRGSSGTTDDVYLEIGEDDGSGNFTGFLYGFSTSLDVFYHRYFIDGTQTYNTFTKYGQNLNSLRWHWVRAHWRTSGTQYGEVFRVEDSTSLNSHSDSMTFPSVRQHDAILISQNSGVPLVAKFWIGTASDDWPT